MNLYYQLKVKMIGGTPPHPTIDSTHATTERFGPEHVVRTSGRVGSRGHPLSCGKTPPRVSTYITGTPLLFNDYSNAVCIFWSCLRCSFLGVSQPSSTR